MIAENAKDAIPYFSNGLKVVARSMPTSAACDHLKKTLGTELYEGLPFFILATLSLWALFFLSLVFNEDESVSFSDFFLLSPNWMEIFWKHHGSL